MFCTKCAFIYNKYTQNARKTVIDGIKNKNERFSGIVY